MSLNASYFYYPFVYKRIDFSLVKLLLYKHHLSLSHILFSCLFSKLSISGLLKCSLLGSHKRLPFLPSLYLSQPLPAHEVVVLSKKWILFLVCNKPILTHSGETFRPGCLVDFPQIKHTQGRLLRYIYTINSCIFYLSNTYSF